MAGHLDIQTAKCHNLLLPTQGPDFARPFRDRPVRAQGPLTTVICSCRLKFQLLVRSETGRSSRNNVGFVRGNYLVTICEFDFAALSLLPGIRLSVPGRGPRGRSNLYPPKAIWRGLSCWFLSPSIRVDFLIWIFMAPNFFVGLGLTILQSDKPMIQCGTSSQRDH